jgi:phage-related baseplate assembly protein
VTTLLSSATAIDLSKLPAPDVVEQIDFEAIRADILADFAVRYPQFSAIFESDPAVKLIEAFAYRETVLRAQFNDRARGVMLAYADGADLDNLAALYGVTRLLITPANPQLNLPAVLESDDDLRRRTVLAPDSFSVAGPESAYIFHALSASGDVLDASATSPVPGAVVVTVQSRLGNGTASAALLAAVEAVVNSDGIRPLTDLVTVQSAQITNVAIVARLWLYPGPDAEVVLTTALERLVEWQASAERLGRNITRTAIIAALHVPGAVQRVELDLPANDLILSRLQAANILSINVAVAGYDY